MVEAAASSQRKGGNRAEPNWCCGGLLVASQLLVAAPEAPAQLFRTVDDGVVSRSARHVGRDSITARRFDLTLDDAVQRGLERNLDLVVNAVLCLVNH